jgi:hypothetical protein
MVDDLQETEVADGDDDLLDTIIDRYKQILDDDVELQSVEVL